MTKHLVTSGLIAGFVVALLATLLQIAFLERGILLAERYESGELTLGGGAGPAGAAAVPTADAGAGHDHSAHSHDADDAPFWQRQAKTLLTMIITYCGYGLVMIAGFSIARHFGKTIGASEGLLWGLAGFTAFSMAPAMGLAPALPGMDAAGLEARQLWWLLCAVATVAGLALLAYGHGLVPRIAAVVLLAAPHIIGAPQLAEFSGILPPELAARHAAHSLGAGLVAWVTLGGLGRWLLDRRA